jgi:alkylation response protein AidB-like acyl-CoA dehydrogenase
MSALLAEARAIAPTLRARAEAMDLARRLPADLAKELARKGFFRMVLPTELGGLEMRPVDMIAVIAALAESNASAAWCVMIGATTALNAAYLPEVHARRIWADPDVITGGVFAPRGQAVREGDELVVTGRWPWGSGSANCDWLVGGALVKGPDGAMQARMIWFSREQVELIDTWRTLGMRGTGSGDIAVSQARVPADRSVSLSEDKARIERPLYAFPAFGLLALSVASVALGNARGAIDDFMDLAVRKVPTGSRRPLAEKATTQLEFAQAEARLRAAHAGLADATGAAWDLAVATGALDLRSRAHLRLAAAHAARESAAVVRTLHDLAGGTSVYDDCPLQRRFRDAHVATQHIMVAPGAQELAGRALLGVAGDYGQL